MQRLAGGGGARTCDYDSIDLARLIEAQRDENLRAVLSGRGMIAVNRDRYLPVGSFARCDASAKLGNRVHRNRRADHRPQQNEFGHLARGGHILRTASRLDRDPGRRLFYAETLQETSTELRDRWNSATGWRGDLHDSAHPGQSYEVASAEGVRSMMHSR